MGVFMKRFLCVCMCIFILTISVFTYFPTCVYAADDFTLSTAEGGNIPSDEANRAVNNKGDISPLTAAEIAKSFGIRVYTIGVGTNGMAPYPYPVGGTVQYVNMPVEIDEKTLTQIAGTTEGNYFRATSNSKLKEVYEEIDKLEKTKLNVKEYSKRQEEYRWFALAAFLCVLLEVLLRNSILKKIP